MLAPLAQAGNREGGGHWRHGRRAEMMEKFTPEERTKLRAANQKVMADPVVQAAKERVKQAQKDFRDLKRAKLLQADPSLQPVLDKMQQGRGGDKADRQDS